MKNLHFSQTKLLGGFWHHYAELNRKVTIPAVYDRFSETGRFAAFRCDWQEGMPNKPHYFWDSDVAKWMEGVAYLLREQRDPEMEAIMDETIAQIVKNQKPSGYFNIYYITIEPGVEFAKRGRHELYCAGHLMEAAVAYHEATGKDAFLKAMMRYADYIYQVFLVEKRAAFATPGHEEIELALIKLYDHTGIEKYLDLAEFFIEERGRNLEKDAEPFDPTYNQSECPVRDFTEAKGHAVRACYLYTAMAMLAIRKKDQSLLDACERILKDITEKKLSISGGIGSSINGEAFGKAYELTNDRNYNETCAAIALTMFAGELQQSRVSSSYGDLIERIYFNGMLPGLSLSGDSFFYENALEIDLRDYDYSGMNLTGANTGTYHSRGLLAPRRLARAKVFSCSCCPPNVNRMLASLPRYMYTQDGNTIYCNQFMASRTELTVGGKPAVLELATDYPNNGKLVYTYHGEPAVLAIRIPDWCVEYESATEDGFAKFPVTDGQSVTVDLPMELHFIQANPKVRSCAGRYAVMRGPILYCAEGIDNGSDLRNIELLDNGNYVVSDSDVFPVPVIELDAQRRPAMTTLYQLRDNKRVKIRVKLIPYFGFANRGKSDMIVWMAVR